MATTHSPAWSAHQESALSQRLGGPATAIAGCVEALRDRLSRLSASPIREIPVRYNQEELDLVEAAATRLHLPMATYVAAVALAAAENNSGSSQRHPRVDGSV